MPVGREGGVNTGRMLRRFVLFPVLVASREQDGGPSNSRIDLYGLTVK